MGKKVKIIKQIGGGCRIHVLEMQQKLLLLKHHNSSVFRCFERKNGIAGAGSFGGTPPTPPGRGTSVTF